MSRTRNVAEKVQEESTLDKAKENKVIPFEYGCEIILEKADLQQVKDPSFPNDAKLIWYQVEGETHMDLCRGRNVKIFDMYYDKYGPGAVQKIDFGYGRVNPRLWGYKQPDKRKKK
jgi:hypothetical protein